MDNERSTQGTSAPLLPLLQRFQNIHSCKEEPIPEEEAEVKTATFPTVSSDSVRHAMNRKYEKWNNLTLISFEDEGSRILSNKMSSSQDLLPRVFPTPD